MSKSAQFQSLKDGSFVSVKIGGSSRNLSKTVKGILYGKGEFGLIVIPVEGADSDLDIKARCLYEKIEIVETARFPKEVGDKLKALYKELRALEEIRAKVDALSKELNDRSKAARNSHADAKKRYVETAKDPGEMTVLTLLAKGLSNKFEEKSSSFSRIESVGVNAHQDRDGKMSLTVNFYNHVSRYFSKESYDSEREFRQADESELLRKFEPKVRQEAFKHSMFDISFESGVGLGDKGSLELNAHLQLKLKKKVAKKNAEELESFLQKAIGSHF